MSDSTIYATAADASAQVWPTMLLLAIISAALVILCLAVGWVFHTLNQKWPAATKYTREPEQ